MAIKVKIVDRPVEDVSYVRAMFKGMGLTIKHMFDVTNRATIQYPEEKAPISPRWRGTHRMLTTETGKARCVACGLCPTVCPANCIKLVPGEDEEGNRRRESDRAKEIEVKDVKERIVRLDHWPFGSSGSHISQTGCV